MCRCIRFLYLRIKALYNIKQIDIIDRSLYVFMYKDIMYLNYNPIIKINETYIVTIEIIDLTGDCCKQSIGRLE